MLAVFKHELRDYFHSLTPYLFCAILLLLVGIGAMLYNIQSAVAAFEYVLQFVLIGLTIIVPVLTMRVIAEERKQKTDRLLYSLPLKGWQIVMGKYLALLVIFLIPVAVIAIYPLIFSQYGELYLPTSYGTIAAFIFLGAALVAIGVFISSITDNQGFAAGIAIPLLLFNYYSVSLAEDLSASVAGTLVAFAVLIALLVVIVRFVTKNGYMAAGVGVVCVVVCIIVGIVDSTVFESLLPDLMSSLSLFERFSVFVNGVFDLTALVFYVSVAALFLFLSVQSLEKRRYN